MPSGPPSPRWRVIEQGRRLVVIDTRTGQPATAQAAPATPPTVRAELTSPVAGARAPSLQTTSFDGRAVLVTHPFYDTKAPRRLRLDSVSATQLRWARIALPAAAIVFVASLFVAPWLLVAPLALANDKVRAALRQRVTRWLDRFDQASAG